MAFFVSAKYFFSDGRFALADDDEEENSFYEKEKEDVENIKENNLFILPEEEIKKSPEKISDAAIEKLDSDGDGIFNNKDKHPKINDYFIVNDDNLNGIVDKYERQ